MPEFTDNHDCIYIRFVNDDGLTLEHPLNPPHSTRIVLENGVVEPLEEKTCADVARDALARIVYRPPSQIIFEPRVRGCVVQAPPSTQIAAQASAFDTIALPYYGEHGSIVCLLRPGDSVRFEQHLFAFEVLFAGDHASPVSMSSPPGAPIVPAMAAAKPVQDSMPREVAAHVDNHVDDDSSTDGEGDTTFALNPETPATEPATNGKQTVGSIAESPGVSVPGEVDYDQDDHLLRPSEPDSPLHVQTVDSQEWSSVPPAPLVRSISLGADDVPYGKISPPKGLITYSGRSRQGSGRSTSSGKPSITGYADEGHEVDLMAASDARDEHEVARETASRSIAERSAKRRKLSVSNDEAEIEVNEMIAAIAEGALASENTDHDQLPAQAGDEGEDDSEIRVGAQTSEDAIRDEAAPVEAHGADEPETKKKKWGRGRPKKEADAFDPDADETITVAHVEPQARKGKGGKKRACSPQVLLPSTRATPTSSAHPGTPITSKVTKILISASSTKNPGEYKKTAAFISKHNKSIIDDVPSKQTNFICVVPADRGLPKTAKILRTLAFGKLVVTDDWLKESMKADELLEPSEYIHPDLEGTLGADRRNLFRGLTVFFTMTLYSELKGNNNNWESMHSLARDAGATIVEYGKAFKGLEAAKRCGDRIVFLASDAKDPHARELENEGYDVYSKGLLTTSVLLGQLDLNSDEFLLLEGKKRAGGAAAAEKADEEDAEDEQETAGPKSTQKAKAAPKPKAKAGDAGGKKHKRRI